MSIEAHSAERAILSIIIKNPSSFFSINDVLTKADFVNTGSAMVFDIVKDLILANPDVKIDQQIIFAEAERKNIDGLFQHNLNGELVDALISTHVNSSNLYKYVADVKRASIKRALINLCSDLADEIAEHAGGSMDLRNMVETRVLDSLRHLDTGNDDIIDLASDFEDVINTYAD